MAIGDEYARELLRGRRVRRYVRHDSTWKPTAGLRDCVVCQRPTALIDGALLEPVCCRDCRDAAMQEFYYDGRGQS